ncbi:MAG TPA: helix-turn-helix domain-containing protein [Anaerolineales bacterium]|nr:helix-turn-helix domain-containing protein [Anaerolineales bacterium]
MNDTDTLWTTKETADYLRFKPGSVRALARQNEIPHIRIGRLWRFRKADIVEWVAQKNEEAKKKAQI